MNPFAKITEGLVFADFKNTNGKLLEKVMELVLENMKWKKYACYVANNSRRLRGENRLLLALLADAEKPQWLRICLGAALGFALSVAFFALCGVAMLRWWLG